MKLFSIIFSGIGILLLTISAFLYRHEQQFIEHAKITTGKVIEMGTSTSSDRSVTYYPVVEFATQNGKKVVFRSNVSSNPPAYEVGEMVEVYYEPQNPSGAEVKGFVSQWLAVLITGGLGFIFGTIGGAILFTQFQTRKLNEWLQANGKKIETQFQTVSLNTSVKINGRSPFVVYSQWYNPATQELHEFKSANIYFNPTDFITSESVKVWVDPHNYKKYQMDLSFLPKKSR